MNSLLHQASALDNLLMQKDLYIETQTILHILINKGITTPDEINEFRSKVERSPKVNKLNNEINKISTEVDEGVEFLEIYQKMKDGSLTEEERKMYKEKIDKDPAKYGKMVMEMVKENRF